MSEELPQSDRADSVAPPSVGPPGIAAVPAPAVEEPAAVEEPLVAAIPEVVEAEEPVAEESPTVEEAPAPDPVAAAPEIEFVKIEPVNVPEEPALAVVPDEDEPADEPESHPEIVHGHAGLRVLEPIEGVRTPAQILEQVERARAANAALTAQLVSAEAADAA